MATKSLLVKLGGLTLLVIGVFAVRGYWSQGETEVQVEAEPQLADVMAEVTSEPSSSDGQNEGVTVHGSWRIEVRNPDGSIDEVRTVENALFPEGAFTLARLLSGLAYTDEWTLTLGGGDAPCILNAAPAVCVLTETIQDNDNQFPTLTVEAPAFNEEGDDTLVITGSFIGQRTGSVANLGAAVSRVCVDGSSQGVECGSPLSEGRPFSGTNFAAVGVQEGQQVLVTVTYSFS